LRFSIRLYLTLSNLSLRQHLVYLVEETLRIGEAIVDSVRVARCVQYNGTGDREDVIRLHKVLIVRRIDIYDSDRFAARLQDALQGWLLQLVALAAIGAAKGKNAYRRVTVFQRSCIPVIERTSGQGTATLRLNIAPSRPDEQHSHHPHNGQDAQPRHYLYHEAYTPRQWKPPT
jgi:hypothetical protein